MRPITRFLSALAVASILGSSAGCLDSDPVTGVIPSSRHPCVDLSEAQREALQDLPDYDDVREHCGVELAEALVF